MAEHGASPGSRRLPTLSLGAGPAQPFRRSLTDLADEKVSFLDAAILILSPLAGLRPSRSGITLTLNLPNPGRDTSAPLAAASTMSFKMSSTMDLACALLTPCPSAIFATSSVVFIAGVPSDLMRGVHAMAPARSHHCVIADVRGGPPPPDNSANADLLRLRLAMNLGSARFVSQFDRSAQ